MRRQTETIQNLHKQCGDFETLLGDAKILTKNIKNSTGKVLDGLQELSRQIGKRADYCAICFENKKSHSTNCGHLVCSVCAHRMQESNPVKCFHCRQTVTHVFKVYL
jgi:hypothetical protein